MSSNPNRREMATALEAPPSIFKLDVDCFEELFDWLSLEDLHAFGQTCKRMQQVAGYFFRLTYSGARVKYLKDGIHCNDVQVNSFSNYIENIMFVKHDMGHLFFVKSNEFESIKKISFQDLTFTDDFIARIKIILSKVEAVEMFFCRITGDMYERFFQYCANMKLLHLAYCTLDNDMCYDWLFQRRYPKLEKLLVISPDTPILKMNAFFERNPEVQHFAASQGSLCANRHSILGANVKLDTLMIDWSYEVDKNNEFRNLLEEFRESGVYKRLHSYVFDGYEEIVHQMIPTNMVEKLTYSKLPMHASLIPFINLKELYSCEIPDSWNIEAVAGSLLNLEQIYLWSATLNHVFAFIRRSQKLGHIAVQNLEEMEGNVIDLASSNKEREKLAGARKVTVCVDEKVFLATKEATNNKDYPLIGIKRLDSHHLTWDFVDSATDVAQYYSELIKHINVTPTEI